MSGAENDQVPYWIERLWSDCEVEVLYVDEWPFRQQKKDTMSWDKRIAYALADKYLPVKLLDLEGRRFVWWVCKLLGVLAHGIPGQACQLVERCLSVNIRRHAHLTSGSEEWLHAKHALKIRVPMLIAVGVQLSAKMSSAQLQMNANVLRDRLMRYGITHTVEDINEAEMEVFNAIGYRVPLWTSVETAQMLATEVGMSLQLLKGVALIADMCEYYRNKLQDRLRWAAYMTPPSPHNYLGGTGNLRSLHLAAGAVAATGRYLRFIGPDPISFLANSTHAPQCYIKCICDIILNDIIEIGEHKLEPPAAKRRRF